MAVMLVIPLALVVFCGAAMIIDLKALDKQIKQNEDKIKNGA